MNRFLFVGSLGLVGVLLASCNSGSPQPPAAPTNVSAVSSPGSVTVAWQDAGSSVSGFTLYRWAAGSGGSASTSTQLTTVGAGATTYRDYTADPSTSYVYAVEATGPGGTSSATQASAAAAPTPATLNVAVNTAAEQTLLQGTAGRYETSHPAVTVTVTAHPSSYKSYVDSTLGSGSSSVDVAELDVIWPAEYASDLADLEAMSGTSVSGDFFTYASTAGTVGGTLIAAPWYADVGLLYYRTDLLQKYGFSGPPATWSDLESMAQTIQSGEQATNSSFVGYVWEGAAAEGLTCNALEWFASSGGGDIISSQDVITVDNAQAVAALTAAVDWVSGSTPISPSNVTSMTAEGARSVWDAENAAFMRNWAYAYAATAANTNLAGKFDVAPLPSASGGTGTGTLGGWMLGVASHGAHPHVATNFVLYATSAAEEVHVATDAGYLPSRPGVYSDASVQAALPFSATALTALSNAVTRPSVVTGSNYGQVSAAVYTRVHNALSGSSSPATALQNLQSDLVSITGFTTGSP